MDGILEVLEAQGVRVVSEGRRLPITVDSGSARVPGRLVVNASKSTQFVTAALLPAPVAKIPIVVVAEELSGSRGYLGLTVDVMRAFGADVEASGIEFAVETGGYRGVVYEIEPDASAAVYPMVAAAITGGRVVVEGLGRESLQPDYGIASVVEEMGCQVERAMGSTTVIGPAGRLEPIDVDLSGSPDGALAVAVACLRASGSSRIRGLESLRYKESDRLSALATEINRTGGSAEIESASLLIQPGNVSHVQFETYSDHRMAMSLALLGLVSDGVSIGDPNVVAKTWPGFWEMLDQL
jgi:3-phosphoshikimate 1-carboxyvinyltransferase